MTKRRNELALFGGPQSVRVHPRRYNSIGPEEETAALRVIRSGVLSKFVGAWHDDFRGGPEVSRFESACRERFGAKHAVTMNSLTSGLIAALGAVGLEPGDEVVVTPWTMCASATAILHWNAIPVFADIEDETFCLSPEAVEANLTERTRAIVVADIFGHPADTDVLMALASRRGLKVVVDSAQAPGATVNGVHVAVRGHVGGYSLNYHKHIHTGEGGIMVTDDDEVAERMQLIRNHGEAVVEGAGISDLRNVIGYNFRLGEIESAIGFEQLRKLDGFLESRRRAARRLTEGIGTLAGIRTPIVRSGCTHAYYIYGLVLDVDALGVGRDLIFRALEAEGVPALLAGYQNLHLLPMYQNKIAYGRSGFPWNADICHRHVDYGRGICPVAERLHSHGFLGIVLCLHEFSDSEVDEVILAFRKVWEHLDDLAEYRGRDRARVDHASPGR